MTEEDEKPKVSKAEEKESFLKELDKRLEENKKLLAEMQKVAERNEEIAARTLLGGKSDAGVQPLKPIEETALEYAKRVSEGRL